MCGRYCLETPADALVQQLMPWLSDADEGWLRHYAPRRLIRPGEPVLALRQEHGRSQASHMLWGLLPGWVKQPGTGPRPINAKPRRWSRRHRSVDPGGTTAVSCRRMV